MHFVEFLTAGTYWDLLQWSGQPGHRVRHCYALDGSPAAFALARKLDRLTGMTVELLDFRANDIRDERGLQTRLRVAYRDLAQVQAEILREQAMQATLTQEPSTSRLDAYLAKTLGTIGFAKRTTLWRALMTVEICRWAQRRHGEDGRPVLFMSRRPWLDAVARYAARHGVDVIPAREPLDVPAAIRRLVPPDLRARMRQLRRRGNAPSGAARVDRPRIGVESYCQLNLDRPERYSDLTFWQQSSLAADDLLMLFQLQSDPLDDGKRAALAPRGIDAVAVYPHATTLPDAEVFAYEPRGRVAPRRIAARGREERWLAEHGAEYDAARRFWEACFRSYHIGVYVSWFKYTAEHCAIAEALHRAGGALAMYQRAYEFQPSAETAVEADVFFGFHQAGAEIERQSGSRIGYHVTTGYLGGHRIALWRGPAQQLRSRLQQRGARTIVAFADENSKDDARWYGGHELMRRSYAFLLEQLLATPWLGLVVKPKMPSTLRYRLGPVARLLERALATGRCEVYESGLVSSSDPPMAAALAADLMVHGHLCSATAGVEAALAGVPTLLLDEEGWSVSPLYRLGVGRVVFNDWDTLWRACQEAWQRPGGVPGFGDWSSMLDELDPFRDGLASQRMGTYLQWVLEGFKAKLGRETALADAAERYAAQWGRHLITSVNPRATSSNTSAARQNRTDPMIAGSSQSQSR